MPWLIGSRIVLQPLFRCAVNVLFKLGQADHALGRFDGNAHLIPIIGAG